MSLFSWAYITSTGLRDTNSGKVKMTEEYLFQCQYVFIVEKIQRSITAENIRETLTGPLSTNMSMGVDRVIKASR